MGANSKILSALSGFLFSFILSDSSVSVLIVFGLLKLYLFPSIISLEFIASYSSNFLISCFTLFSKISF